MLALLTSSEREEAVRPGPVSGPCVPTFETRDTGDGLARNPCPSKSTTHSELRKDARRVQGTIRYAVGGAASGAATVPRTRSDAFSAIMIVGALVLPRGQRRHHRGVDHAQAVDAAHAQLGVHDGAHRAGADRVVEVVRPCARTCARMSSSESVSGTS